jgi:hypothetical protein
MLKVLVKSSGEHMQVVRWRTFASSRFEVAHFASDHDYCMSPVSGLTSDGCWLSCSGTYVRMVWGY